MAERMYIVEFVTEHNYMDMYKYVRNGSNYPGCHMVVKRDGSIYMIDKRNWDSFTLDVGDEVHRHMITGDHVALNRQPTLSLSSIATHKVIVNPNPEVYAVGINQAICTFYNADFDGDQMMLIPINTIASRSECLILNPVKKFYISEQSSQPRSYLGQDDLTLVAELTRSDAKLTRGEAMTLFENIIIPDGAQWHGQPIFDKWGDSPADFVYTGRDLVSMILPKINYTNKSTISKSGVSALIDMDPQDFVVNIDGGIMKSGILDKSSLGGSTKSLLHSIYLTYDIETSIQVLTNLQILARKYAHIRNFTMSPLDFHIDEASHVEVQNRVRSVIAEGTILENQYYNGEIIPPRGVSVKDYFEQQSIQILQTDYIDIIVKSLNHSHLVKMIIYGAKGDTNNLNAICGAIGQVQVGNGRPLQSFAPHRANIFCHQYDQSPIALGFIADSYTTGQQPRDFFVMSMKARDGITKKAIMTAKSGHQGRIFMRNMENLTADYRMRIKLNEKNVQLAFGDCGYDPRRVQRTKIPGVHLSWKKFEEQYHYVVDVKTSSEASKKLQKAFDVEYANLLNAHNEYIKAVIDIETMSGSFGDIDIQSFPIDFDVTMKNIQSEPLDNPVDIETLLAMRNEVEQFVERIPYLQFAPKYWNNKQLQKEIPSYVLEFHNYFIHYIQLHLASTKLQYYTPESVSKFIKVTQLKFMRSLVQPGEGIGGVTAMSIGEVFTQSTLNTVHNVGAKNLTAYTPEDTQEFAKGSDNIHLAKMMLRLKPEYEKDRVKARLIAAKIQMSALIDYVDSYQIFFEEFAHPIHPRYKHEARIYEQFLRNYNQKIPQVEPICFRMQMSAEKMIDHGISMLDIIRKLQILKPAFVYVVSYETDRNFGPIIRAHPIKSSKNNYLRHLRTMEKEFFKIMKTIIRGLSNISQVGELESPIHRWDQETGEVKEEKVYMINTRGSNLVGLLEIPEIDHNMVQTTSVGETQRVIGLAAARTRIMIEWSHIVPNITNQYFSMIASLMTMTGSVTGLSVRGQLRREENNVFGNMCAGHATATMMKGAMDNKVNMFYGTSGPAVMGQAIKNGTNYFNVGTDVNMIVKHKKLFEKTGINSIISDLSDLNSLE
jgi:DNA-directed RNA polymerase beta' subunit